MVVFCLERLSRPCIIPHPNYDTTRRRSKSRCLSMIENSHGHDGEKKWFMSDHAASILAFTKL